MGAHGLREGRFNFRLSSGLLDKHRISLSLLRFLLGYATILVKRHGLPRCCYPSSRGPAVWSRRRMGLETLLLQTRDGLADGFVDAAQLLLARQRVVGKHQVQINGEPRHVAQKEVDRTALEARTGR
jgi:hypothetical protein